MDILTLLGLLIGIGGILLGNTIEGGHFTALLQMAAALIVFGGTFGATLVANTMEDFKTGMTLMWEAFRADNDEHFKRVADEIITAAQIARRESILAVENKLPTFSSDYMKNVFRFMIDGTDPAVLRDIFEKEMDLDETRRLAGAKVWTDAGGFAPTIGIIGAVLGLIHVMANLSDSAALGQGIAVAFVATIYGVGSANLVFIPIANKIKRKIQIQVETKQMIVDGAVAILTGLNPYIIEEKIRAYALKPLDKVIKP